MRFLNLSFIIASIALIAGCNGGKQVYLQQSQQVKPLQMPTGVNLKDEQNYYPLPNAASSHPAPPSLVPPNSQLQRLEKKTVPDSANVTSNPHAISIVKWSQGQSGEPILVLLEKQNKAWSDVGKALSATDYQVLDRDPSMSSYYILDTKATGNQITEKTPIYRVFVQADNDTSKVLLLSEKNNAVSPGTAKKILQALEQHLV
ncbi:MAG: hypothetical protein A3F10_00645 [Coxiella sp. RIFCSPHIGHO2_12_FULL_42_15]|nr:MAG: hypothetical protein A3F10_00645 [Coxiella sp. RIFCSPHIGHO2_12_FULL_42_15]